MAGNSFGQIFRIHTFGESHGPGLGVIIDGCPAGVKVNQEFIQQELERRKPGQSRITTQRKEEELFVIQSGVFEGVTTGTPISIFIPNTDQKSKDYKHISDAFRPSHADMTYDQKFGHRDYRGGGRSSARETVARVAAGAIAKMILESQNIVIRAGVTQIGEIALDEDISKIDWNQTEKNIVRCPDKEMAKKMEDYILEIRQSGDTVGGRITCLIENSPVGLGDPVFDKLHADLAKAMLSINAVKGFEYGSGFNAITMKGSEHNDIWESDGLSMKTKSNYSGGIQGGISNGMPIYFNVAFKPVATIMQDQETITKEGEKTTIQGKGRHDPCVVPRAVPIVEAMAALVMVDHLMRSRISKI